MKNVILLFLLSFGFIFVSCNGSSSGGEVVTPGIEDAYIIDAALCTSIENNLPSGITNYFFTGERVNLWVNWGNITKGQKVKAEWFKPNNEKQAEYTVAFQSNAERQISINYLDLSSFADKGEWLVRLYIDSRFMRSYRFTVN